MNGKVCSFDGDAVPGGGQSPLVIMLAKNVGPISMLSDAKSRGRVQRTGENFRKGFPTSGIKNLLPERRYRTMD